MQLQSLLGFLGKSFSPSGGETAKVSADGNDPAGFGAMLAAAFGLSSPGLGSSPEGGTESEAGDARENSAQGFTTPVTTPLVDENTLTGEGPPSSDPAAAGESSAETDHTEANAAASDAANTEDASGAPSDSAAALREDGNTGLSAGSRQATAMQQAGTDLLNVTAETSADGLDKPQNSQTDGRSSLEAASGKAAGAQSVDTGSSAQASPAPPLLEQEIQTIASGSAERSGSSNPAGPSTTIPADEPAAVAALPQASASRGETAAELEDSARSQGASRLNTAEAGVTAGASTADGQAQAAHTPASTGSTSGHSAASSSQPPAVDPASVDAASAAAAPGVASTSTGSDGAPTAAGRPANERKANVRPDATPTAEGNSKPENTGSDKHAGQHQLATPSSLIKSEPGKTLRGVERVISKGSAAPADGTATATNAPVMQSADVAAGEDQTSVDVKQREAASAADAAEEAALPSGKQTQAAGHGRAAVQEDSGRRTQPDRSGTGPARRDLSPTSQAGTNAGHTGGQDQSGLFAQANGQNAGQTDMAAPVDTGSTGFEAALMDLPEGDLPVEQLANGEETAFTPEQKAAILSANRLEAPSAAAPNRSTGTLAWLRSMLAQTTSGMNLSDGWKSIEVQLEDGQGTMTVSARRGDGGLSISVSFSDPNLRSLAEANAQRLQDALQNEYQSSVDLSLSSDGSSDTPFERHQTHSGSSSGHGRSASGSETERSGAAAASTRRTAVAGVRNEWIG